MFYGIILNMLKDNVPYYYLEKDQNCAETVLHIINDEYHLNLTEDDFLLIGGFGGGCGCGITWVKSWLCSFVGGAGQTTKFNFFL